ncbi:MAG: DUF2812 domain-containing protein [Clostridia bacterium]|nr:DUF2812 domain-containing protein [Clostridia bacterium]
MEKYFEKMSEKGWMADYFGAFTIRFKACEPKKRKFQIAYSEDGDILGQGLYKGAKELDEMIDESTDYRFIFKRKRRLVYVSENPDTVDIDTDKESALKCIDGVVNEYGMAGWILMLFSLMPLILLVGATSDITDLSVISVIVEMMKQPIGLIFAAFMGYGLINIILYKIWYRRSSFRIATGNEFAKTEPAHYIVLIYCIFLIVAEVAVLGIYLTRGDHYVVASVVRGVLSIVNVALVYGWYEYWKNNTKGNGGLLIGVAAAIIVVTALLESMLQLVI